MTNDTSPPKQKNIEDFFGKEHAKQYDEHWEKLSAINYCLYLQTEIMLSGLAKDARILCVGVGTGRELFYLAEKFPNWTFTALDTSAAMLDVCKLKAEEHGFIDRIEFFQGEIESLPSDNHYHAATAFLVSQFLVDSEKRRAFFNTIQEHLLPDGLLISCDITQPRHDDQYSELKECWVKMQIHNGLTPSAALNSMVLWDTHLAVSTEDEIRTLLTQAGFANPTPFFQAFFIRAWVSKKSA